MPIDIEAYHGIKILETEELSQDRFSTFGTVIQNPQPDLIPSQQIKDLPPNSEQANQGSALKYLDVTHLKDYYSTAPSDQSAKVVMNMFVCAPRPLLPSERRGTEGLFPVEILERHPYTTQTFIPLGTSPTEQREVRYLVIVAPSLPPSSLDAPFPVPPAQKNERLPGRGLPDLRNIRAFIASGSQAVTYGVGTWHAPMVAIGKKPISFVVVQFANGVAIEDCQEVKLKKADVKGIFVGVPKIETGQIRLKL
jgi:ureidoglycolate lyase